MAEKAPSSASPAPSANSSALSLQRIRRRANGSTPSARSSGGRGIYAPDDAPGIKVDPIVVLVMSLIFIGSVFLLHIWGKYARA